MMYKASFYRVILSDDQGYTPQPAAKPIQLIWVGLAPRVRIVNEAVANVYLIYLNLRKEPCDILCIYKKQITA